MVYERYPRDRQSSGSYSNPNSQDYGRSDSGGYGRSSARDYAATGEYDRNERSDRQSGNRNYGNAPYGGDRYGQQDRANRGGYGSYQANDRGGSQQSYGSSSEYHGAYASDGHRFEDVGRNRYAGDDNRGDGHRVNQDSGRGRTQGDYGRQPQGYDYDDRGFIARAGDEVRSWFGDDDAERRREADARYDDRSQSAYSKSDPSQYGRYSNDRDDHYHNWRSTQIAALDRDYDEYRTENRSKFDNEFNSWRTERQGQRSSLSQVAEHMEVVGSDGSHVGTVDKVRGDRILLTKNDKDAGGVHHSIPSRWIVSVEGKVTLSKSADDAKAAWKEEERNSAMFDYGDKTGRDRQNVEGSGADRTDGSDLTKGRTLDKSFSGTY